MCVCVCKCMQQQQGHASIHVPAAGGGDSVKTPMGHGNHMQQARLGVCYYVSRLWNINLSIGFEFRKLATNKPNGLETLWTPTQWKRHSQTAISHFSVPYKVSLSRLPRTGSAAVDQLPESISFQTSLIYWRIRQPVRFQHWQKCLKIQYFSSGIHNPF